MAGELRIGGLTLAAPFVQAALSGYSDLPMRRLARRFGVPYTLNEVVLDKLVVGKGKKRLELTAPVAPDDHPVGAQLMGADPAVFGPAAADLAAAGYDVIDINFGCPVRKVLGRCRGGYLLSDPDTALAIVRRVRQAVGDARPVTVKLRRGTDDSLQSAGRFWRTVEGVLDEGVSAVTVHPRTVQQRYVGPSDWSWLRTLTERFPQAVVLGSGDLFSAPACVEMLGATGVSGVSIARGCIGNPWIFQELAALLRGEPLPPPPSIAEQRDAIAWHFAQAVAVHGPDHASRGMRKFGIKYSEHHPLARSVRDAFVAVTSAEAFEAVLDEWYAADRDWPPVRRRVGHGNLVAAGAQPHRPAD